MVPVKVVPVKVEPLKMETRSSDEKKQYSEFLERNKNILESIKQALELAPGDDDSGVSDADSSSDCDYSSDDNY